MAAVGDVITGEVGHRADESLTRNAANEIGPLPQSSSCPGLVPGIHVFQRNNKQDVDGRDSPAMTKRESFSGAWKEPEYAGLLFQSGSQEALRTMSVAFAKCFPLQQDTPPATLS